MHGSRSLSKYTVAILFLTGFAALGSGCVATLYKVKPAIRAPLPATAKRAESGGLVAAAVPLLSDEENQDLFDFNLPASGLLPVRIELVNGTNIPVKLEKARFRMRDQAGREWKLLSIKQTASRIMKADDVRLYNPNARDKFRAQPGEYGLETKTTLAPNERRQGLLFFETPDKGPVESPRGLTLTVERLPAEITIPLT
jgi:hypothetical protein